MSSEWEHEQLARGARQWPALQRLIDHVEASPLLDGMVLVGSFAKGEVDPLSDLDLVLAVPDGRFEAAWAARQDLHGADALVAWDQRDAGFDQAGAHKWLTRELVLVECLLATASSGVRLASPAVVVAGDPGLLDAFPRRPPIPRAEVEAHSMNLHPIERTYDAFKAAARAALSGGSGGSRARPGPGTGRGEGAEH